MTPEVIAKLESSFSLGHTDEEACLLANIDMSTLYRYCERNRNFTTRKELLKKTPTIKARRNIIEQLNERNVAISTWYLERKAKEEFSLRQELTGADGESLVKNDLNKLETNYDQFGQETAKQIVANEPPVQNQDEVGGSGDVQNESSAGEARSAEDVAQTEPSTEG